MFNKSCILLGRGIVTCKKFDKGDFLLEYVGERISLSEGDRRENIFSSGFRYFLKTFWYVYTVLKFHYSIAQCN